jgi:hypothetical protein
MGTAMKNMGRGTKGQEEAMAAITRMRLEVPS